MFGFVFALALALASVKALRCNTSSSAANSVASANHCVRSASARACNSNSCNQILRHAVNTKPLLSNNITITVGRAMPKVERLQELRTARLGCCIAMIRVGHASGMVIS